MSKERKILKIVSLVLLAWGIIQLVLIITRLVGGLNSLTPQTLLGCHVLSALASFVVGWEGIQGANKPSVSFIAVRNSIIILLIYIVLLIAWGILLAPELSPFVNAAVVSFAAITILALLVAHICARKVRAQTQR